MIPVLLTLLLVQADDRGRIGELIRALDAEDVVERDEAALDLVRIGVDALPALEDALQPGLSEELKARIPSVAAAIRREFRRTHFGGGPAQCGLSARLTVVRRDDGTLEFKAEIMNVGSQAKVVVPATASDLSAPDSGSLSMSSHGGFAIKRLSGESPNRGRRSCCGCGHRPSRSHATLAPGESMSIARVVKEADELLTPGDYEADFRYYAKSRSLLPGADADLVSNTVNFTVAP